MLRNVPCRKKSPRAVGSGKAGGFNGYCDHNQPHGRRQPSTREPRKVPPVPEDRPTGFICGWCRSYSLWASFAGFFKRLKFCNSCMAAIRPEAMGEGA